MSNYQSEAKEIMQHPLMGSSLSNPTNQCLLERCETMLGIIECDDCGHSLHLHLGPYGCEHEFGDSPGGEGDHGPYGEQARGTCGCEAKDQSADGVMFFELLKDVKQWNSLGII